MIIFYFTGTGNSLAVAKKIGNTNAILISIPQVIDSDIQTYKDDVIGVVFPVYSFRAPKMVRDFLEKVKLEAGYLFLLCTYGTMAGPCLCYLRNQAKKHNYSFNYTNKICMLDNYLPLFETGKQIKKLPKKKIDEKLKKVIDDIDNRKNWHQRNSVSGRIIGKAVNMDFTKSSEKYQVNDKCNLCGICQKVCLAKNIVIKEKIEFNKHCEACFACLHLCPRNAIHHKKEKSNKRWLNPEVTLKEIIEANNRSEF